MRMENTRLSPFQQHKETPPDVHRNQTVFFIIIVCCSSGDCLISHLLPFSNDTARTAISQYFMERLTQAASLCAKYFSTNETPLPAHTSWSGAMKSLMEQDQSFSSMGISAVANSSGSSGGASPGSSGIVYCSGEYTGPLSSALRGFVVRFGAVTAGSGCSGSG